MSLFEYVGWKKTRVDFFKGERHDPNQKLQGLEKTFSKLKDNYLH